MLPCTSVRVSVGACFTSPGRAAGARCCDWCFSEAAARCTSPPEGVRILTSAHPCPHLFLLHLTIRTVLMATRRSGSETAFCRPRSLLTSLLRFYWPVSSQRE